MFNNECEGPFLCFPPQSFCGKLQQTVENYNSMVPHLRVVTHCTGIHRNILVCHFRITGSRQRVITRYKSLSGKHFDYKVMWDFPRLADEPVVQVA